jgi:hypothetical protein
LEEVVVMAAQVRRFSVLIAVLALAATFASPGFSGSRDTNPPAAMPTIYVVYTMNCTFSLVDDFGKHISSIPPGNYQVEVSTPVMFKLVRPGGPGVDEIAPNDFTGCKGWVQFQLTGPGVDLFTTLDSGCDAFLLLPSQNFKPGATYTFQDMNQPAATRTLLTIDKDGTPPTPPTNPYTKTSGKGDRSQDLIGSARLPTIGTLNAMIGKSGKLSLTNKGKTVLTLKTGKYKFVVTDESTKGGFTIEPVEGKAKSLSGIKFTGKLSKGAVLKPGRWMYHSASGRSYYFLVTN